MATGLSAALLAQVVKMECPLGISSCPEQCLATIVHCRLAWQQSAAEADTAAAVTGPSGVGKTGPFVPSARTPFPIPSRGTQSGWEEGGSSGARELGGKSGWQEYDNRPIAPGCLSGDISTTTRQQNGASGSEMGQKRGRITRAANGGRCLGLRSRSCEPSPRCLIASVTTGIGRPGLRQLGAAR